MDIRFRERRRAAASVKVENVWSEVCSRAAISNLLAQRRIKIVMILLLSNHFNLQKRNRNPLTAESIGMHSPSVLVVDDDDNQLSTMALMLSRKRYFVTKAGDVDEAWSALEFISFDLVVSDFNMSPLNGLQFLSMIRHQANLANTPFLMVTAERSVELWKNAIASGATEFLLKPFTYKDLQNAARTALDVGRADANSIVRLRSRGAVDERSRALRAARPKTP